MSSLVVASFAFQSDTNYD